MDGILDKISKETNKTAQYLWRILDEYKFYAAGKSYVRNKKGGFDVPITRTPEPMTLEGLLEFLSKRMPVEMDGITKHSWETPGPVWDDEDDE